MSNEERQSDPDAEPGQEPAEPLNRAERRAQRRGRKPALPPSAGKPPPGGYREHVVQRRAGRRGNR